MTTTPAHQRFWQWLKNFPKRHKFITALVLLYVLWKAIMTPIPNPFAKDAITVRGRFPFDQGYQLVFSQATYSTHTAWLSRKWCGFLNSNTVCGGGHVDFYPKQTDGQHYELTVYADYYLDGLLDWVSGGVSYFFAAKSNVDVTKQEISSIGVGMEFNGLRPSPAHYACDDSQQAITKNKEKLLCKPVKDVKKYRDFPVTALPAFSAEAAALGLDLNDPRHPKVQEYNFWLESELDAKLAATQQGAKP